MERQRSWARGSLFSAARRSSWRSVVVACGGDDDDGGAGGGGGKVALLLPESKTTRYEAHDRPEFEAKVEEACPDCELVYSNANQDAAKQQSQVEAALTEGVDVLVLDPVDSASAASMVNLAKQQDVPVISYDRLILDSDGVDYYVSFDNVKVGELQGKALAEGSPPTATRRARSSRSTASPTDNNAKLFRQGAESQFDRKAFRSRRSTTPRLEPDQGPARDGAGDHRAREGRVHRRLRDERRHRRRRDRRDEGAGIDPKTIPTTGQDAELEAIQRILAGEQFMTVYKATSRWRPTRRPQIAVALAQGEDVPEGLVNGETDNGIERSRRSCSTPVAVTIDNIQDTVIKADGFQTVDDICVGQYAQACQAAGGNPVGAEEWMTPSARRGHVSERRQAARRSDADSPPRAQGGQQELRRGRRR